MNQHTAPRCHPVVDSFVRHHERSLLNFLAARDDGDEGLIFVGFLNFRLFLCYFFKIFLLYFVANENSSDSSNSDENDVKSVSKSGTTPSGL